MKIVSILIGENCTNFFFSNIKNCPILIPIGFVGENLGYFSVGNYTGQWFLVASAWFAKKFPYIFTTAGRRHFLNWPFKQLEIYFWRVENVCHSPGTTRGRGHAASCVISDVPTLAIRLNQLRNRKRIQLWNVCRSKFFVFYIFILFNAESYRAFWYIHTIHASVPYIMLISVLYSLI